MKLSIPGEFPKPVLPEWNKLPIVRPLPDPFQWSDPQWTVYFIR